MQTKKRIRMNDVTIKEIWRSEKFSFFAFEQDLKEYSMLGPTMMFSKVQSSIYIHYL